MNQDVLELLAPDVDALSVPAFDFPAIQTRAGLLQSRLSQGRRTMLSVAILFFVVFSLAAAATHFTHLKLTNRLDTWQLYGPAKVTFNPSRAAVDRVQRQAPYRIVWPASLPAGTSLRMLVDIASEVVVLEYRIAHRGRAYVTIAPTNSDAINADLPKWLATLSIRGGTNVEWQVGEERVRLETDCLTAVEIQRIRSAMVSARKTM